MENNRGAGGGIFKNRHNIPELDGFKASGRDGGDGMLPIPSYIAGAPPALPGLGGFLPASSLRHQASDATTSSNITHAYSKVTNGGFSTGHSNNVIAAMAGFNNINDPYQVPQRREPDMFVRPNSIASNGTFATQVPMSMLNGDHESYSSGQMLKPQFSNGGSKLVAGGQRILDVSGVWSQPRVPPSETINNDGAVQQYNKGQTGTDDLFNMSFGDIRLGETALNTPAGQILPVKAHTNGYANGYSNGNNNTNGRLYEDVHDSSSEQTLQDSVVQSFSPSAFVLARSIMSGDAEDRFDRSIARYTTPTAMTLPALGPARFNNTKMFSVGGGLEATVAAVTPSINASRRTIMPSEATRTPDWLGPAQQGNMTPSFEEASDSIPFTELYRLIHPSTAGVLRINGVPYNTTRQEMTAFIGRNAQIARQPEGSPYYAIHILMERETGKTMDCFIEVTTPHEAAWVVRQFSNRTDARRQPKVGDRAVEVICSSQDELMTELFPRAKHVRWSNGQLLVDTAPRQYYQNNNAAGFQGFIHFEELIAMAKHANQAERSAFASRSPCRVYEALITLLYKYPWYAVDHVTIAERRCIYDCVVVLMQHLIKDLNRSNQKYNPLQPTPALLQELAVAALSCVGFSEKQKAIIYAKLASSGYKNLAEGHGINVDLGGNHEFSTIWPFAALSIKPGADMELVRYYADLFRAATVKTKALSLAARQAVKASVYKEKPMGEIHIDYGKNAIELSLADVAKMEYDVVEQLLDMACDREPYSPNGMSAPASLSAGRHGGGKGNSARQDSANGGSFGTNPTHGSF